MKENEVEKFEMGLKFVQEDRDCVQTEEKSQPMCPRVTGHESEEKEWLGLDV